MEYFDYIFVNYLAIYEPRSTFSKWRFLYWFLIIASSPDKFILLIFLFVFRASYRKEIPQFLIMRNIRPCLSSVRWQLQMRTRWPRTRNDSQCDKWYFHRYYFDLCVNVYVNDRYVKTTSTNDLIVVVLFVMLFCFRNSAYSYLILQHTADVRSAMWQQQAAAPSVCIP